MRALLLLYSVYLSQPYLLNSNNTILHVLVLEITLGGMA